MPSGLGHTTLSCEKADDFCICLEEEEEEEGCDDGGGGGGMSTGLYAARGILG